jgi:hypothetical protein
VALRVGRSVRVLAAAWVVVPLVTVGLVLGAPGAAVASTTLPDIPDIPLPASLEGAAVETGGALAEVEAGVTVLSGSEVLGLAAVGYASYWGTTKLLNWQFGNPPSPGAQPVNSAVSNLYKTLVASGPGTNYDPLGAGSWVSPGSCRAGTGGGVFGNGATNVYGTCFQGGNTIASTGSGTLSVNLPAWRCKVTDCSGAVKFELSSKGGPDQQSETRTITYQSAASLCCFNSGAGNASSHGTTIGGFGSCPGWSAGGWSSQAACQDAYTINGFDLWYDSSKIEWSPVPVQSYKTTRSCADSAGSVTTTTSVSANFYANDPATAPNLASAAGCPSSTPYPRSASIQVCAAAGAAPCTEVASWTAASRVANPPASDPYRDCLPGGANYVCFLRLYKGTATGFRLCDHTTDCSSFDPSLEWSTKAWKCTWGGHVMPLTDCERVKTWTATTSVNQGTDPDPTPVPGISWDPNPSPTPNPNPSASPSPSPSTSTAPSPSPSSSVAVDPPGSPGTPDPNDTEGVQCFPTGWGMLNPVEWVYKPVKCALSWAFVPNDVPSFTDVGLPLPPGWVPSLPSLGAGSCGVLSFPRLNMGSSVGWIGPTRIANTCDEPWPTARTITYYGLLASALVTVGYRAFRILQVGLGMYVDVVASGGDDE